MVLSVSPQPPVYMLVLLIRTIESSVILETVEWGGGGIMKRTQEIE